MHACVCAPPPFVRIVGYISPERPSQSTGPMEKPFNMPPAFPILHDDLAPPVSARRNIPPLPPFPPSPPSTTPPPRRLGRTPEVRGFIQSLFFFGSQVGPPEVRRSIQSRSKSMRMIEESSFLLHNTSFCNLIPPTVISITDDVDSERRPNVGPVAFESTVEVERVLLSSKEA